MKVDFRQGKFFLTQGEQSELILNVRSAFANRSRIPSHQLTTDGVIFPLEAEVKAAVDKIFTGDISSMTELIIYLKIVAKLLSKPQIHNVLYFGQWSPLAEELEKILPKFNPANKLYSLSEDDNFLLPENKFDTIIFPRPEPPPEVLSAVKDFGKIFLLTEESSPIEIEVSPLNRQEIRRRTTQGQLDEKISEISQVVMRFPTVKKNSELDEYIAEVVRAEKILAEIFPALPDDTTKFDFNLFKEFLIDWRLGNGSLARVNHQYVILAGTWNNRQEEYF